MGTRFHPKTDYTREQYYTALGMYADGVPGGIIARKLKVNVMTVYTWASRAGIRREYNR